MLPLTISSSTLVTPLNGSYWFSLPVVSGVCIASASANINASVFINNTFKGSLNMTNTSFSYTITPSNGIPFFNEYSYYVNCSVTGSSLLSATRQFYYANSSGVPSSNCVLNVQGDFLVPDGCYSTY